ncbi:glycosyltransferase WbuB [Cryobacterium frigoriphilum]|uniref:D-inositol 3-phosphate glycosyltransferase n=1 Tax=Cryobacterium frigoriphilum TaxID=1259150 RepID=A0A4V3IRA2_9MICO|nr:glycosyltransferase family 4 protein [Cryobacterium frigoriphilum]TFD50800.1 glycosyltransferase WbuB [Cryobacterium frigoriphilum]
MVVRPARVVLATRLFTPEVGAGSFRLQALTDALVARGAQVEVVTTTPPRTARIGPDSAGVTVSRFPALRDAGGNVRGYVQYLSFDLPLLFRLLFRRADVIVSEPPPTTGVVVSFVSALKRRPYVYYAADIWTDALNALAVPRVIKRIMRAVEGFVFRHADAIIAVSDEVAARVTQFGVDAARLSVANNGINTALFTPHGALADTPGPVFVYTGTMSEWQGASVFLEAMSRVVQSHPTAQLRFFGQGSDESALRATAARLGLTTVTFGGVVPPDVAALWLRSATAALASIKPGQGYDFAKPTKIYAAAACGTPVIFAGAGAGAQLVNQNALGWGADYTVDAVAAAMGAAIDEHGDGTRARLQQARSDWAESNASLRVTGQRAADAVLASATRGRSARSH